MGIRHKQNEVSLQMSQKGCQGRNEIVALVLYIFGDMVCSRQKELAQPDAGSSPTPIKGGSQWPKESSKDKEQDETRMKRGSRHGCVL